MGGGGGGGGAGGALAKISVPGTGFIVTPAGAEVTASGSAVVGAGGGAIGAGGGATAAGGGSIGAIGAGGGAIGAGGGVSIGAGGGATGDGAPTFFTVGLASASRNMAPMSVLSPVLATARTGAGRRLPPLRRLGLAARPAWLHGKGCGLVTIAACMIVPPNSHKSRGLGGLPLN